MHRTSEPASDTSRTKSAEQLAQECALNLSLLHLLVAETETQLVKEWIERGASGEEVARRLQNIVLERGRPLRNEELRRWLEAYLRTPLP